MSYVWFFSCELSRIGKSIDTGWDVLLMGWGILKLERGGGFTTLWMHEMMLNCIL